MRTISTCAAMASLFVVFAACGPKQDPSAQQPPAMAPTGTATAPYGAYPTATGTVPYGYPQQGYPQQAAPQPTYAAPTQAPTAAPTAGGAMAVPGAGALPCSNDLQCLTHHCNTQYGKCAFPCQSNSDCITPNVCNPQLMGGSCVPAAFVGGAAPAQH